MGWPKSLFGFFHKLLRKNPNELFGQPNIYPDIYHLWCSSLPPEDSCFSSSTISLYSEEFLLAFIVVHIFWWWIPVCSFLPKNVCFTFILKDILVRYRILDWQFFFFKHFRDVCFTVLTSIVYDERSAVNSITVSLSLMCHFLLAASWRLLFAFHEAVLLVWGSLCFWNP